MRVKKLQRTNYKSQTIPFVSVESEVVNAYTKRGLKKISGERNKGERLVIVTGPEMDTRQTSTEVSCDGLIILLNSRKRTISK